MARKQTPIKGAQINKAKSVPRKIAAAGIAAGGAAPALKAPKLGKATLHPKVKAHLASMKAARKALFPRPAKSK